MFCPNCGTKIPSNAKMCPNCGTPLPESDETAEAQPDKSASAPKQQPQRREYGGAARIFSIVVSILLLVIGISRCTGVTKKNTSTTTKTPQSTRGTDSSSSDNMSERLNDPEFSDAYGNITLYAFMELDGKQLVVLCSLQNFDAIPLSDRVVYSNSKSDAIWHVNGKTGTLSNSEILDLAKGGEGGPCMYDYRVSAYDSEKATYEGLSHCTTDCSATAPTGEYVAVCHGSSDRRYLAVVDVIDKDTYGLSLYNPEALERGRFNKGEYGKDAESIFKALTDKSTDTHE